MKTLQLFSDEYLEHCRELSSEQIVKFLEDFRKVAYAHPHTKSKLISIKIPPNLLTAFKVKAKLSGKPYQTKIKELMRLWLLESRRIP